MQLKGLMPIIKYYNAHISISCAVCSNVVIDLHVFSYRWYR